MSVHDNAHHFNKFLVRLAIFKAVFEKYIFLRLFPNLLIKSVENFSNELIYQFIIYQFTMRLFFQCLFWNSPKKVQILLSMSSL